MSDGRLLTAVIDFGDLKISCDVAATYAQIEKGLAGRTRLEKDQGMLFILEEPISFWMKDMKIPLDIIWMNRKKEIVALKKRALPCPDDNCPSLFPIGDFSYVLEIKAGLIDKYKMNVGDWVDFDII